MKLFSSLLLLLFLSCAGTPDKNETAIPIPVSNEAIPRVPIKGKFLEALYISQPAFFNEKKFNDIKSRSLSLGINGFIIDAQPRIIPKERLQDLKKSGITAIARIVNFEGGLIEESPSQDRLNKIRESIKNACLSGFQEINLDYIRYADGGLKHNLPTTERYNRITGIIRGHRNANPEECKNIPFSADVFGRVPFIQNDAIGQRIENFADVLDAIYPMLYPSHFYGHPERMYKPYDTIKDGMDLTKKRMKYGRAIAWIQGFKMHVGGSGLSYKDYILVQMKGARESNGDGFVVWNAGSDYEETFLAMEEYKGYLASKN
jgi:hypothetical protein